MTDGSASFAIVHDAAGYAKKIHSRLIETAVLCSALLAMNHKSPEKFGSFSRDGQLFDFNNFTGTNTIVWGRYVARTAFSPSIVETVHAGLFWIHFQNVCVNEQDHVRYMNVSEQFEEQASAMHLFQVTEPFRLAPIASSELESGATYVLQGRSLIVGCWRSGKTHPYHFMFGYGKLYQFMRSFKGNLVKSFNNIIFFQCPDVYRTDFFQHLWRLIFHVGFETGFIDANTKFYVTNSHSKKKHILCTRSALFSSSTGSVLGANDEVTFMNWRSDMKRYVHSIDGLVIDRPSQISLTKHRKRISGCNLACTSRLRVVIFQRSSGTSRRNILNVEDVKSMLNEYVGDIKSVTLNETSTFIDAVKVMNEFDIMITTYGSHIVNFLLTLSQNTALIEVAGVCLDASGFANLKKMTSYHRSLGHLPVDPDLIEVVKSCTQFGEHCESKDPRCPHVQRRRVFRADLVVNVTLLRGAFEEAAAKLCACS